MKYFLDTEFLEGKQTKRFCGFPIGKTPPTIDLISIGIVAEDGREYYAISKDFNLREAWNRYQVEETGKLDLPGINRSTKKVYWIRENVLKPIFDELYALHCSEDGNPNDGFMEDMDFSFMSLRYLIRTYAQSNKEIAKEIVQFVNPDLGWPSGSYGSDLKNPNHPTYLHFEKHNVGLHNGIYLAQPDFYAYFADYDWVAFCWLFGKMIDLPDGFPQYCRDIKQIKDELIEKWVQKEEVKNYNDGKFWLEHQENYPQQDLDTKHHSLHDARYDKELYEFLISLQTS